MFRESLAARLQHTGTLPVEEAARLMSDVAASLAAAHRAGAVHCDIRPANVLIDNTGSASLVGFDQANSATEVSLTATGSGVDAVAFLAPEVARGGPCTEASDVFSLGATLYACVEGRAPFILDGGTQTAATTLARLLTESAPPADHGGPLVGLISRMLAANPGVRPDAATAAGELAKAARIAVSLSPDTWPPEEVAPAPAFAVLPVPAGTVVTLTGGPPPRAMGKRGLLAGVSAAVVVVAAITAVVLSRGNRTNGAGASGRIIGESYRQVASYPVGGSPQGMVVSRSGRYVVVASTSIVSIDVQKHASVVSRLPDGLGLMVPDPNSDNVFVATGNSASLPGAVYEINPATGSTVHQFPTGSFLDALAITPDGKYVIVAAQGNFTAFDAEVIRVADGERVATVTLPGAAQMIVASDDFAYVALPGQNAVEAIDLATRRVSDSRQVGLSPTHVCISPDGRWVVASNQGTHLERPGSVTVIDTASLRVSRTIGVGRAPASCLVSKDDQRLYVANSNDGTVSVINLRTGQTIVTAKQAGLGDLLTLSRDGTRLYAPSVLNNRQASGRLLIFDARTGRRITEVPAAPFPQAIGISPDGKSIFILSLNKGTVTMLQRIH